MSAAETAPRADPSLELPPMGPLTALGAANPYPLYTAMRQGKRHVKFGPFEIYLLTRYDEVLLGFKRPELFSSMAFRESRPEMLAMRGATPQQIAALNEVILPAVPTVINSDPPAHGRYRGILNRGFTPREIGAFEPRIREITKELVDRMLAKPGPADLVSELTIPLPVTVIAELLGVDETRHADFKRWSDAFVNQMGRTVALDATIASMREFNEYFAAVIERRRAEPGDDLISRLVHAETSEGRLTPLELLAFTRLLLVAGNETTTNLIGNAVIALLENPEQLERLRAGPELVPNAVEEALRYDSPVQGLPRVTAKEVELGGEVIPQGSRVMLMIGSANRDPDHWPEADRFDIGRDTTGHLGFGFGIHFCLGSHLARLESRCALEAIAGRLTDLRFAGEVTRNSMPILRGPARLPVDFRH
jgi:cytochrome P450